MIGLAGAFGDDELTEDMDVFSETARGVFVDVEYESEW